MNSNILNNKRVLIFQQRNWALRIGHFLAQRLQQEGCHLSALTLKKTTHQFVCDQTDVSYQSIVSHDDIMEFPENYLKDKTVTLSEVCEALGVDSIWPFVNSLRNHVRNYGKKFYYSYQQNMSDEEIVNYVKAVYLVFNELLDREQPELIMAPNFVAFPHIMMCLLAKRRGIPMQAVTDVKVKGRYMFTYSFNDDEGPFFDRLKELKEAEQSQNQSKAVEYLEGMRKKFAQPDYFTSKSNKNNDSLLVKLKVWKGILLTIYGYYRRGNVNALKTLGITGDSRTPKIILRDYFQKQKNEKLAKAREYVVLEGIKQPYAYFPLQFQPEATIDVFAPFFSNQIDAIRQVAMALPGDMTLVVKDHPSALGYRSDTYLQKVASIPNVKLVDYRTPADQVLKGALVVISPNSTTLMEGAIFGKPGIQLGNCGTTEVIPHVSKRTDIPALSAYIRFITSDEFDLETKNAELENYVAAAYDTGWEFNYHGLWERGEKADMERLWDIYVTEICRVLQPVVSE